MKFGEAMRLAKGDDYIRSRYNGYIAGERDVKAEQEHATRLLGIPERDRTKSWAASGAGKCLRQRQFAFLGMPGKRPDYHSLNIFLNGTWVHIRHQVVGLTAGYLRDAEVPLEHEGANLRGTADAVDDTGALVEYKSINQNGFMQVRQFGVKADHKLQVHSYMLAGDFQGARVVYENKNTNDLMEFYVERDERLIADIQDDLENLNLATENKYLLPMLEECTKKEGQYRWCPFASQCSTATERKFTEWKEVAGFATLPTSSSGSAAPLSPSRPVFRATSESSSQS